ncbi:terpene cyclase/mutase family protein [bacterium]|nr:terpene cyclase/mutase family protein [bacterium]
MSKLFFLKGFFPNSIFIKTAEYIASVQEPDGSIPWFKGGYTDPWDHVEATMGLSICGKYHEAENAYQWLRNTQRADGSWWNAYKDGTVQDKSRIESNFVAYVATGVWHHFLITQNRQFLNEMWPVVKGAIEYVLSLQTEHGEICWAIDPAKGVLEDALVTGCSSIYKSLECAINIASVLDQKQSHWIQSRNRLGHTLRNHPERFDRTWESKSRYSMDWFYPVLAGVITGPAAISRLNAKWDKFVVPELGCRCVSDEPWVTIAESCELTMALIGAGNHKKASQLFSWLHDYRTDDGSYWTGYVYPKDELWPDEKPTWTAGAVLLAADALAKATSASQLLTKVSLVDAEDHKKSIHYA